MDIAGIRKDLKMNNIFYDKTYLVTGFILGFVLGFMIAFIVYSQIMPLS